MKKIVFASLLFLGGAFAFAEIPVPFFGNNNFTMDVETVFSADANDGSTGLETDVGLGLWFEYTPYADRNITPQRDTLSVSLKMANSAFYAWRGYDLSGGGMYDGDQVPSDVTVDQATSIWFDTFAAQLEYNQWWMRIAGIEPEISVSQASLRSVFDPVIANRTDIAKNRLPLPLFYVPGNAVGGGWSHGSPGITSVINRNIVHINRREVEIAGNLSAGMKGEIFDFDVKVGSWKVARAELADGTYDAANSNIPNAWVFGGDASWRPDLSQSINFSILSAVNYDTVTRRGGYKNEDNVPDPLSNPDALKENPIALGLGYEYRLNLPNRMVLKPYLGVDFIYEITSSQKYKHNAEFGGGVQWYFRGTSAAFKRNTTTGGVRIGDVEIPAALVVGMNIDLYGICNAIISFNEDPRSSPLPNLGGWFQVELLNIGGREYSTVNNLKYKDFMWAGIVQVEYLVTKNIMPYVFFKYLPADMRGKILSDTPVYNKDIASITSKLGCRFTPFNYFSVDVWYERTDVRPGKNKSWEPDNGLFSVSFGIRNYL